MAERDVVSWNSMVSGYAKVGDMEEASSLFQHMPARNLASWNSMISGYVRKRDFLMYNAIITCYSRNSRPKEAIELFNQMLSLDVDIQTDEMTLASVLSACSQWGDLRLGTCYNDPGKPIDAINLFEEMLDAHIRPNLITYTVKLTAYDHAGLVKQGYSPQAEVWGALLLACKLHCKVEFGEIAAQNFFDLEPETTAHYSLHANIYTDIGRWDDAKMLRRKLMEKGMTKITRI
ncbi:Pentatricopeptide repeat [Dillenia turbinata]|uniref:Pentatricopeptide repeat n=1 Tax=Dillenia turbinata TaxID=194707 RepID=A0AAN8VHP6_9MAGN